jgi:hypothetical protein
MRLEVRQHHILELDDSFKVGPRSVGEALSRGCTFARVFGDRGS